MEIFKENTLEYNHVLGKVVGEMKKLIMPADPRVSHKRGTTGFHF